MPNSFKSWLIGEIKTVLHRQATTPPFLLWCDPDREWLELLRAAASADAFEFWADPNEHELLLRDRFYHAPRAPRVVWLPCARENITYFKVFELEAEVVWEKSLLEALRDYGVSVPREQKNELKSLLPAHAREWFDKPKNIWKELTPGNAKGTLVDDHRMLEVLAGESGEFERLRSEKRFAIFVRRAVEDFGLPDPTDQDEAPWRVAATARLLCTEASVAHPQEPPGEGERIIPSGLPRDNALKLLRTWQENIYFIPSFERLVQEADKTLGLAHWAQNLKVPPRSRSSRAVEEALFEQYSEKLSRIDEVDTLARELERDLPLFKDRESGFWGRHAMHKVGWDDLVQLAEAASLLVEHTQVETVWRSVKDAVGWYDQRGWRLDMAGEALFEEAPNLPAQLHSIRARLRLGYLRATDRIGSAFSDLLAHDSGERLALPTAGEVALEILERSKAPTALVFLDACRLDLGQRLAERLNTGETAQRAEVSIALAPLPSITPLGMAFALPVKREKLRVELAGDRKNLRVTAEGFSGDLTLAEERRKWMAKQWDVKEFLTITEVLDGNKIKRSGKLARLIVVHGDEFDITGHEGLLQLTGATEHLKRYAQAIRRLREAGYSRIIVVTDHGFFHWQPEADEIEDEKPSGDIMWSSRRAIVGRGLSHPSALRLPVPQSDLEAMIPRSVNAFKTYGGLGYFHGGATLQELIIPVVVIQWPAKASKVAAVLKPVGQITSEAPRVQVEAGLTGQQTLFGADNTILARRVQVKVQDSSTGKVVFKHDEPITVEPGGGPATVQLRLVESSPSLPYGSQLVAVMIDADDEEILAREEVTLRVDINEW